LTGQGDRGNLRAFNGGADGVTDSRHVIVKPTLPGFAGGAIFCFYDQLVILEACP